MGHVGEKLRLMAIGGSDLTALLLDFPEQPRVLDRQGRLSRKGLKELDDFRRKVSRLLAPHRQRPHDAPLSEKRNRQYRSIPKPCKQRANLTTSVFLLVYNVGEFDRRAHRRCSSRSALTRPDRCGLQSLNDLRFHKVAGPEMELFRNLVVFVNNTTVSS